MYLDNFQQGLQNTLSFVLNKKIKLILQKLFLTISWSLLGFLKILIICVWKCDGKNGKNYDGIMSYEVLKVLKRNDENGKQLVNIIV